MIGFIWADIRRHAAGVLAVVLLIALASALGVCVTLSERAVRLGSARAAAAFDLVVGAPGSETQLVLSSVFLQPAPLPLLPGAVLAALRADPRVAFAAPVGFGDFAGDDPVVGTTSEIVEAFGGLGEGRGFQRLRDAVVGAAVERRIGTHVQPLHGRLSDGGHPHDAVSYEVVGRMKPTGTAWDKAILVPIEAVWAAHDHDAGDEAEHEGDAGSPAGTAEHRPDLDRPVDPAALDRRQAPGVPAIVVKPRTIAAAYALRQAYRQEGTLAVFPAEVLTRLYGTLGDARTVLQVVAYGAQGLVGAAILFVIVVHVLQRRRQIGALRAFGAPRRAVFLIVWAEIVAMVGLGVCLGFAIGFLAALTLARLAGGSSGIAFPVELRPEDLSTLLALLAAVALVALVPAGLTYRQSPASALRA